MKREDFFYYLGTFLTPSIPAILFFLLLLVGSLSGCGAPTPDPSSANGKQQLIDKVNQFVTVGDCADAVALIEPVYASSNTDDDIRMATASAYGCDATIDYFGLIGDIVADAATFAGSGLFTFLASTFPSTQGKDYVVEGAEYGMDAVQATLVNGAVVLSGNQINSGGYNVGSVLTSDHTNDANIYLMLLSMAAIGGLENRNGPAGSLPWTTAIKVTQDGCAMGAALLNFSEAMLAIESYVPTNLATSLKTIQPVFGGNNVNGLFDQACAAGCNGSVPANGGVLNTNNKWVATGCALTCSTGCPTSLMNRTVCTGVATDKASCAAAGLVNFLNASAAGW